MLARILSYGLNGIEGYPVFVEVDIVNGLPSFETVGLPDAAVKESKDRVRSAIRNSGLEILPARITVNLAPADTKKEGSLYDLPIAIGLLAATDQIPKTILKDTLFIGELSLNGDIQPVQGVMPIAISARSAGYKRLIIPKGNSAEAQYIDEIETYTPASLQELVRFLRGDIELTPLEHKQWADIHSLNAATVDFAQIKGQKAAKRAAEIAAAGGHNLLMVGPPGSGKTMIARAIPSILPDLTFAEALEVTKIHSIAGILDGASGIVTERPFRAPHHTASVAALSGGGTKAKPGEVSAAHNGVLFLDELPEYPRTALEALRQPLEDGVITVSRVYSTIAYPARFMLVASMNPCPCGNYCSRDKECRCTLGQIQKYLSKVSGPLLDRIDLQIEVDSITFSEIRRIENEESSEAMRKRVQKAREIQSKRFVGTKCYCNAQMDSKMILKYCLLDKAAEDLMKNAFASLKMSARAYNRILKVARSIADLAGKEQVMAEHIAEAIQYRSMDRKYWSY